MFVDKPIDYSEYDSALAYELEQDWQSKKAEAELAQILNHLSLEDENFELELWNAMFHTPDAIAYQPLGLICRDWWIYRVNSKQYSQTNLLEMLADRIDWERVGDNLRVLAQVRIGDKYPDLTDQSKKNWEKLMSELPF